MYLHGLIVQRFRSCKHLHIPFHPELSVLLGENNGGKSNLIEALRILTLPLNGRRDRYAEEEDIRRDSPEDRFELTAHFRGLSDTLKGLLVRAVPDPTQDEAIFGLRYEGPTSSAPRGRLHTWAGKFQEAEPEAKSTDLIRHVYLPPLRDAQAALGSGSAGRVMGLFRHFLPKEQEPAFLESIARTGTSSEVLNGINAAIGEALHTLTSGVRPQQSRLEFSDETLMDVARDLKFRLADAGIPLGDIRHSGLGYANLLYIATVAAELARAKEADLTLFLVEEPEAHLHPQLQMLVLDFLLKQARESQSRVVESGEPEGRIQVIVTTHSPNLTAWVDPKHLVVLRTRQEAEGGKATSNTVCIPIGELGVGKKAMGKLKRYLDVSRSALLFGNRALLVEGIAEAILLPVMAEHSVLKGDDEALRRFKGTAMVAIDGVDFKPYVEVLLKSYQGARIADRVVVVTDADPAVEGNRKEDLKSLAAAMEAGDALSVHTNERTLEFDLFTAGNESLLKAAFLEVHPRSSADWESRITSVKVEDRAEAFLRLMEDKRTRKGDLAQALAEQIAKDSANFKVPEYLERAIREVSQA